MDTFIISREIRQEAIRRRRLISIWLAISIAIGLFVAFRPGLPPESRQYQVWLASVDILVDTTDSQVVDARGPDPAKLANRASLLGNLVTTKPLRAAIGAGAGVPANQLVVVPPAPGTSFGPPATPAPVTPVASRTTQDQAAKIITLSTDESQPILHATAQAPDASTASRLATGALEQLKRHLADAQERAPAAHPLVVRPLAVRPPAPETRGTSLLLGFVAALMVAMLGCSAIVAAPMVARRWAQAERAASRNGDSGLEPTIPFDRAAHQSHTHEDGAEVAQAAVVAGPGAIRDDDVEQPIASEKAPSSRRRRKHGRPR